MNIARFSWVLLLLSITATAVQANAAPPPTRVLIYPQDNDYSHARFAATVSAWYFAGALFVLGLLWVRRWPTEGKKLTLVLFGFSLFMVQGCISAESRSHSKLATEEPDPEHAKGYRQREPHEWRPSTKEEEFWLAVPFTALSCLGVYAGCYGCSRVFAYLKRPTPLPPRPPQTEPDYPSFGGTE